MTWDKSKAVGDAHEARVMQELASREWHTAQWGQAILPDPVRRALSASNTRWRHFPDIVAVRNGEIVAIDCKDRMASTTTGRYAIKRDCVSFGLQFLAAFNIPIFYVFGNLGVLTPTEVTSYGTIGPRATGGAYYLIGDRLGHNFDDVFGSPVAMAA